jgi:hypothetical protein
MDILGWLTMTLALIMGLNKETLTGSPLHVKNRDFPRAVSDLPPFRSLLEFALRPEK